MRTNNILTIIALFTLILVPSVTYSAFEMPINWSMEDYTTTNYTYIVDGANTYHGSVNDSAQSYGILPIGLV